MAALAPNELKAEFLRHSDRFQTEPTALVSVSSRIIDTVKRAYDLLQETETDNIWVIFIELPSTAEGIRGSRIHSAQRLAEDSGLQEPQRFHYEYLFEGEIPRYWVSHKVSLETLMQRGLDWVEHLSESFETHQLRRKLASEFTRTYGYDDGMSVGFFARLFGARAPLHWITHQFHEDCLSPQIIADDVVRFRTAEGERDSIVDYMYFRQLDEGIEFAIVDLFLQADGFLSDYDEFVEWKNIEEGKLEVLEEHLTESINKNEGLISQIAFAMAVEEHAGRVKNIEAEAILIGL
ncbi:hypothetical protein GGR57DRAFT_517130 [Xylariaceae sp. FL1272]|nr:hypothetical protein GGR57DRAFT_517130 [Xylariaceae sp. FL1272]